jgi:phosphoribosylamine-glycine ligase
VLSTALTELASLTRLRLCSPSIKFLSQVRSRETCIIDSFLESDYEVEIYCADKQRNPFNLRNSRVHKVTGLDPEKICEFAKKYESKIDFGIVTHEKPIIDGIKDLIEAETEIQLICPSKEYALEASKVKQRELMSEVVPEVCPKYKVFKPEEKVEKDEVQGANFLT